MENRTKNGKFFFGHRNAHIENTLDKKASDKRMML